MNKFQVIKFTGTLEVWWSQSEGKMGSINAYQKETIIPLVRQNSVVRQHVDIIVTKSQQKI